MCVCMWLVAGCVSNRTETVSPQDFARCKPRSSQSASEIKLAPGDVLLFSVEAGGRMEVDAQRVELSSEGLVTAQLVGDLNLNGLPVVEAKSALAQAYAAYYVNDPVIMLSVEDRGDEVTEWGYVTVLGHVAKPGRIPLPSPSGIYLSKTLQEAGGFAIGAKQEEVRVYRVDVNGKKMQCTVNLAQLGEAGNVEADLELGDGDVVFVPQRFF